MDKWLNTAYQDSRRQSLSFPLHTLKFGRAFEHEFINQELTEDRTIEQTLTIGWRLLSMLPQEELTRVSTDELEHYYGDAHDAH